MSPIFSLEGKVGLITGIANEKSISTGVAEACAQAGAKIIITYQNEKTRAFLASLGGSVVDEVRESVED